MLYLLSCTLAGKLTISNSKGIPPKRCSTKPGNDIDGALYESHLGSLICVDIVMCEEGAPQPPTGNHHPLFDSKNAARLPLAIEPVEPYASKG